MKKPVKLSDIQTPVKKDTEIGVNAIELGSAFASFLAHVDDGTFTYGTLGKKRDGSAFLFTMNTPNGMKRYASGTDISSLAEEIAFQIVEWLGGLEDNSEEGEEEPPPF